MEKLPISSSSLVNKELMINGGPSTSFGGIRTNPELKFDSASPGEIFNFLQQLITTSKWDIRYKDNTPKLSLFRDHMFYYNKEKELEIGTDEIKKFKKDFLVNYKDIDILSIIEDSIKLYVENTNFVSSILANIYEKTKINTRDKFDYLERNGIRKFSENHFAISSYNLIAHEISVSDDIPNTVSAIDYNKKENNRILTILPSKLSNTNQELNLNFKEKTFNSIDPNIKESNIEASVRHYEFLVTQMIKELSYSYQGKIYIKYNDDIEIGDTITLLDNSTSTFGIFEIDAFEHTLDERGLITVLFVKAKVNHVDPILDLYNLKIGYQMMNEFQEKVILQNNSEVTLNYKLKNIFGFYLKTLMQSPKYLIPKYLEESFSAYELFNSDDYIYDFNFISVQTPIRFYPLFKKGKMIYPNTLEFAFFNDDGNEIQSLIATLLSRIANSIKNGVFAGVDWVSSVVVFLADFTINNITLGISDIIKPLLGFSEKKALEQISSELYSIHPLLEFLNTQSNYDLYSRTIKYNPYNGIYNLGNFDLTIGFFNIQAQTISNMFPSNASYDKTQIVENLNIKTSSIKQIISQAFNISCLVEAYDTFNTINDIKIDYNSDIYNYNLDSFLNDIKPKNSELYESFHIMRNVLSNKVSNEYGILNSDGKYKISNNRLINLDNGRKAIETTIDISLLNINSLRTLKVIWFHNIYNENDISEKNVYQERKNNVNLLIKKYENLISDNEAIIIMADFNLNIFNYGEKPLESSSAYNNATMELPSNCLFKSMNKKATTVNKYGEVTGNPYDNILASNNIVKFIKASRFVYPIENIEDRKIISDHVPIFIGIKKQ